jgi:thimet oligopeptidase
MRSGLLFARSAALVAAAALVTSTVAGPAGAQAPSTRWTWTPQSIEKAGERAMGEADKQFDAIAKMSDSKRTFENTVKKMELINAKVSHELSPPLFIKYVSTDAKIREAGDSLEVRTNRWGIKTAAREDLYKALKAAVANDPPKSDVDKRLVEKMTLDFELNGLSLPKEKREQVIALKQRIADLGTSFDTNLNEAQDSLLLTKEELAGMPQSYIDRLDKAADGRYKVTVSYPDFYPFMQNSTNAAARAQLEMKFSNRAHAANLPLLKEALVLRQELADVMGYKTFADYATVDRMAKKPEAVMTFLTGLADKLRPYRDSDIATLSTMKKQAEGDAAGGVTIADWRFYDNQLKKTKYEIDNEEIRQYFPLDVVTSGLMATYQKLFDVKFEEIKNPETWHEDVQLFKVSDAKSGKLIGHFYLDLFPRPNKYGHAAAWSLVKGATLSNGKYQTPVSAMVCNFTKPTATDPSLLGHDEVETYFHEFGHVMHNILTQAPYAYFSGTSVYQDFVEAPSQMLENWVWDADVLQTLSGHYKDNSKKLPKDLLGRMIAAKNLDNGLKYSRQVFFALTDMRYHTQPTANTTEVWHDGMKNIFGIPASEGSHEEATFGHLFGYEAGYYSYLWAEVFAADMFSRFQKEGVMNPITGRAYRDMILAPGGTREPMVMLKEFLGREPNQEAFLKQIGLTGPPPPPASTGTTTSSNTD